MFLLLFAARKQVDQVMMLVPDAYDIERAKTVAADALSEEVGSIYLAYDLRIQDNTMTEQYQPYIG